MAILTECPYCHRKQSLKNKKCSCGADMDKLKKAQRVKYHVQYRMPDGKQKRESVGTSIEKARETNERRKGQVRQGDISSIPKPKRTFKQLTEWFLDLENIKAKKYYTTLTYNLNSFNAVFGDTVASKIRPFDLENYQTARKSQGLSDSYIDQEVGAAKNMIYRAYDNDLVSLDTVRTFQKVKKLLRRNSNARDMVITGNQFKAIMKHITPYAKPIVAMAYYTGMRREEILSLTWDKVDMKKKVIRLEASDTKDNEPRTIPICDELYRMIKRIPRSITLPYVFLYRGQKVKDIRTAFSNACERASIPYGRGSKGGITLHDLRHTFNTNMRKAGVSESVIMEITGHATREMFDRYNTIDLKDARDAITRMEDFLGSQR